MTASSPRCIQRLVSDPHPILKPLTSSSSSSTALPPSPSSSTPHSPPPPPPASFSTPQRQWLSTLLATKFYGPCPVHPTLRKNDLNLFCTTHAAKICQYCQHASHTSRCTILHVSRYMYHDVLLAKEALAHLDLTDVQSYLNNGNRVVYIDRRAQPKSKLAPHAKSCTQCARTLQDPFRFCSVFCRLQHDNHPAAAPTLPVPDATPLLHPQRKQKSPDRPADLKRHRRSHPSSSTSPPLRLPIKRRRKSTPYRSPLPFAPCLLISRSVVPYF